MALELRQTLKLSQQLIMTPQLQQAIKLLQLSRMELVQTVQQELQENPILEELPEETEEKQSLEEVSEKEGQDSPEMREDFDNIDWVNYIQKSRLSSYTPGYEDEERPSAESVLVKATTLYDHLIWQLRMQSFPEEEEMAAALIVGNINDDGYLTSPLDEIVSRNRLDPELAKRALKRVQELDPVGVGAADLRECLLLQIKQLGLEGSTIEKIVANHLPDLERRNYKAIVSKLGIPMEAVAEAAKHISMLEPKPGRPFGGEDAQYITPDIYVYKVGEDYVIVLNDDGLPKLRISSYYKSILSKKDSTSDVDREYIKDKLRSAVWLIRSIHQRQRTIYKVTRSIFKFQREFLDRGVAALRPLILRDVAEDINMHESSISRVTTNKYVHTPQGIYELKYFFNSGISSTTGDSLASESVKNRIQQIIAQENQEKPYSDQEIVKILARDGIEIARRTVTKYREMLGILSSTKRKKLF